MWHQLAPKTEKELYLVYKPPPTLVLPSPRQRGQDCGLPSSGAYFSPSRMGHDKLRGQTNRGEASADRQSPFPVWPWPCHLSLNFSVCVMEIIIPSFQESWDGDLTNVQEESTQLTPAWSSSLVPVAWVLLRQRLRAQPQTIHHLFLLAFPLCSSPNPFLLFVLLRFLVWTFVFSDPHPLQDDPEGKWLVGLPKSTHKF